MSFSVVIAGRPNVGKSTLFNRLTGTQHALTHDQPGITRDRREGMGRIGPLEFTVTDTAGLEDAAPGSLEARMTGQSLEAIREADVALLVIDGRAGVTLLDEHFAAILRKEANAVIVVVNKAEGTAARQGLLDAYALGLGEPVGISAAHGEGMVELYDALAPFSREEDEAEEPEGEEQENNPVQLAVIGRPNAGKSTLINRLLGQERLLTGPEAGITRDAIAVPFTFEGEKLTLVDTAGMRRKSNIDDSVEKMAVQDTLRAIQYAHVAILVIDATAPLEKQELAIASLVEREGRAMVLAVNKWDLVPHGERKAKEKEITERLGIVLPQVKGLPVVMLSGLKGSGLDALMKAALLAYGRWNRRVPTGELNRWLEGALARHAPPQVKGRRIKFRYATQAKARPPSFAFFCNLGADEVPDHYIRYLVNSLREEFDLPGVPLRITLRRPKNPYADK